MDARKRIFSDDNWEDYFKDIAYRPFDIRRIYYSDYLIDRPRGEVMCNMLEENIGLITSRINRQASLGYFFITCFLTDRHILDNARDSTSLFPLYIYPDKNKKDLFNQNQTEKEPNIPQALFEQLSASYGLKPTPEEILYYIYGIFYSNIYRQTYAEFLKIDFPHVPFTANYELFKKMGELGKQLADLHLLKSPALDLPIAKYQGSGDNDRIEKITYKVDKQCIHINAVKYFEGIVPEVWNYYIGGYQVLQKYLKDRKGRNMDDAPRYCRIVTALGKTIEIQEQIDEIYPEAEKELVQF